MEFLTSLPYFKNMFKLFFSLLFFSSALFAIDLEIAIPTSAKMLPLEFSPIENQQKTLSDEYLGQVLRVLQFDFHHNGFTYLIDFATKKRMHMDLKTQKIVSAKKIQAFITIIPKVQNRTLYIQFKKAKAPKKQTIKLELTGVLAQDRKNIHKAHDKIVKTLFNVDGIASSKIIFTKKIENKTHSLGYQSEIWMADWDGGNAKRLTKPEQFHLTPKFVPTSSGQDPEYFLSSNYQTGQPKLHLGQIGTEKTFAIVKLRGNQLLPAMSLQKDKIAFISDAAGRPDLFLVHYNPVTKKFSKPYQLYTYPGSSTASPCFSPDGRQIAFVSDKTGTPRIYILDISKKGKQGAQLLTKKNLENSCPNWSSDGKQLVYVAKVNGIRQIWFYDFATRHELPLTTDSINKENPTWGPDNLHILFNNVDKKNIQLYMLHVNHPMPVQITFGSGEKKYPHWEVWVD